MHTKLHTENTFHARRCADKKPSRLHARRAAIPAGTKISIRRKCEKRLLKINYPGSGNNSQFVYDSYGHVVYITETVSGSTSNSKQFVWSGDRMCEARNASGSVTAQYFKYGQVTSANYFYTKDLLTSVCDVSNSAGNIESSYKYDSFGRVQLLQGSSESDFQYAGYYYHAPSGLSITVHRFYSSALARWLNRDPIGEFGGVNLYRYALNNPINSSDRSGLAAFTISPMYPPSWWPISWPWPFWPKRDPADPPNPDDYNKCKKACADERDALYGVVNQNNDSENRQSQFDAINAGYDDCVKKCGPPPPPPKCDQPPPPPPPASSAPPGGSKPPDVYPKPPDGTDQIPRSNTQ